MENPEQSELVPEKKDGANTVARMWTIIGVTLCVAIFIYLSYVARKAVDEELDDETIEDEETLAFLRPQRTVARETETNIDRSMTESPLSTNTVPCRQSIRLDGYENRNLEEQGNIAL